MFVVLVCTQVTAMVTYLEGLIDCTEDCLELKGVFESLLLSLKILSMEQPSDIVRYRISTRLLTEDKVRSVFRQRSDFNKSDTDAISTVRINMVP